MTIFFLYKEGITMLCKVQTSSYIPYGVVMTDIPPVKPKKNTFVWIDGIREPIRNRHKVLN